MSLHPNQLTYLLWLYLNHTVKAWRLILSRPQSQASVSEYLPLGSNKRFLKCVTTVTQTPKLHPAALLTWVPRQNIAWDQPQSFLGQCETRTTCTTELCVHAALGPLHRVPLPPSPGCVTPLELWDQEFIFWKSGLVLTLSENYCCNGCCSDVFQIQGILYFSCIGSKRGRVQDPPTTSVSYSGKVSTGDRVRRNKNTWPKLLRMAPVNIWKEILQIILGDINYYGDTADSTKGFHPVLSTFWAKSAIKKVIDWKKWAFSLQWFEGSWWWVYASVIWRMLEMQEISLTLRYSSRIMTAGHRRNSSWVVHPQDWAQV